MALRAIRIGSSAFCIFPIGFAKQDLEKSHGSIVYYCHCVVLQTSKSETKKTIRDSLKLVSGGFLQQC